MYSLPPLYYGMFEVQAAGVLNAQNRGFETIVGPAGGLLLDEVACAYCGQCVAVCPTRSAY